jgi:hypothetical protein
VVLVSVHTVLFEWAVWEIGDDVQINFLRTMICDFQTVTPLLRFYGTSKDIYLWIDLIDRCHHSAAEHRVSTRILHLTVFLASVLISAQVFLTPLASSSTVLRHVLVFLGLPLPRLLWGFHFNACLAISSDGFRSVWPSHPHLRFLICKSIPGCLFLNYNNCGIIGNRYCL